ncbi:MAG: alpha/beta hydrolase, partial [Cyanobacteria bacterium J06649_4]
MSVRQAFNAPSTRSHSSHRPVVTQSFPEQSFPKPTISRKPFSKLLSSLQTGCHSLGVSLGLTALAALPSNAAERVLIKIGPIRQAIELRDLESFASTGRVPEGLRLYQRFLSPAVQQTLKQELALDPQMSDRIIEDVMQSANGELLLNTLSEIAPNVTISQLQAAIRLAASQTDGLSVLSVLRAVPQETLEVDISAAIALVSQVN